MKKPLSDWEEYILGAAIYPVAFFLATTLGAKDFHGFIYHYLHLFVGGPLGILAAEDVLPFSAKVELKILFFSPGFYSGLYVGSQIIDKPIHLWKGFMPAVLLMAPLILMSIIPNPGMLYAAAIALSILPFAFPYALFGAVAGWLIRSYRRGLKLGLSEGSVLK